LADLVDTSVFSRRFQTQVWGYFVSAEVVVCPVVRLELLHGLPEARARALRVFLSTYAEPVQPAGLWERAEEVNALVARPVKLGDLLIAAWAELGGHEVVHYDQDYDVICAATGQPTRWVAPRGSLR
jgi:predicted nucleic acid-binding protein